MIRNLILFLNVIFVLVEFGENMQAGLPGRIPILMAGPKSEFGLRTFNFNEFSNPYNQWNCKFDQDFCNLKNAYHLAQFQRHSDHRSPMFGQTSMLYINVTNAPEFPAARLRSDYFPASPSYGQSACLSLKYLLYGTGALKLFVIQQDIENKCIWSDHNDLIDIYGQWRDTQMTINLRDGNPRFFIEAHIDGRPPKYGTVAISTFAITYGDCTNDNTNYCQRRDDQPVPPVPSPVK